jgi:iron complex transport system substrate-binding protein
MSELRIVSFLPSATEMACALGLADELVGITHECDYPPEITNKPIVVRNALAIEGLSSREIDEAVSAHLRSRTSLYRVDERLLQELTPNLILTQNLCQVCAPSGNEISQVLESLRPKPKVLYFAPKSLADIEDNLWELGKATDRSKQAEAVIASRRARLQTLAGLVASVATRPRVFFIEWVDPVYCGGHWVPEMVELAGGVDTLSRKGSDSVRVAWSDVLNWAPEVLIVGPCGFNVLAASKQALQLFSHAGWGDLPAVRQKRVYAVDANAYFARPGPRVIEGVELLAHLIQPELCDWKGSDKAFRNVVQSNHGP